MEHFVVPAVLAAKAAHACELATMMSMPNLLSGDDEGRKTSGVASLTFAEGGKRIALDSDTLLAFEGTSELLHDRDD